MKYIDSFLKKLKTDRNTFLTYVLTLISFYLCIDRIVEIIMIGATGMSVSYWGPIKYTLAGNLCEKYEQLFKVDNLNSIMKKNRDVLLNLTQENFENIYNIILGKENSEKNG